MQNLKTLANKMLLFSTLFILIISFTTPDKLAKKIVELIKTDQINKIESYYLTKVDFITLTSEMDPKPPQEEIENMLKNFDAGKDAYLQKFQDNFTTVNWESAKIDSITYNYTIAKPGSDEKILWPQSKDHIINDSDLIKVTMSIALHDKSSDYSMSLEMMNYKGDWKFIFWLKTPYVLKIEKEEITEENVQQNPNNKQEGQSIMTASETTGTIKEVQVSTLAGSTYGPADGLGALAQFDKPCGVAVDAKGNVYVADAWNHKIRKITREGMVSTLAGSTRGFADGPGVSAQFYEPYGVAVDAKGIVYVVDTKNNKIRKISPDGMVSNLAGSTQGYADGPGDTAQFDMPYGIAVDSQGIVYVADSKNNKIRKISPDGVVSTLAGNFLDESAENPVVFALLNSPFGVAVDTQGNVYVADSDNHKIIKITPDGELTTLAGSTKGFADGSGDTTQFNTPYGLAVDDAGNVYVADYWNHKIRVINQNGELITLAGGDAGFEDGSGTMAKFTLPRGVAIDIQGNVYVADSDNNKIRKIIKK